MLPVVARAGVDLALTLLRRRSLPLRHPSWSRCRIRIARRVAASLALGRSRRWPGAEISGALSRNASEGIAGKRSRGWSTRRKVAVRREGGKPASRQVVGMSSAPDGCGSHYAVRRSCPRIPYGRTLTSPRAAQRSRVGRRSRSASPKYRWCHGGEGLLPGPRRTRGERLGVRAVFRHLVKNNHHPDRAGPKAHRSSATSPKPTGCSRSGDDSATTSSSGAASSSAGALRPASSGAAFEAEPLIPGRCSCRATSVGQEPVEELMDRLRGNFTPRVPKGDRLESLDVEVHCRRPWRRVGPYCRSDCRCFGAAILWRYWARLAVSLSLLRQQGHRRGGRRVRVHSAGVDDGAILDAVTGPRDREPLPASHVRIIER
jgi:hypothetical protein